MSSMEAVVLALRKSNASWAVRVELKLSQVKRMTLPSIPSCVSHQPLSVWTGCLMEWASGCVINHDPPLFVIGFASSLEGAAAAKHTLHNFVETRECTVNIISEHFAEAANSTSINAPYGASEWAVSGLTPSYDCHTVKPARVKEAVFSIEAKLESCANSRAGASPAPRTPPWSSSRARGSG
ncbi:hypothetical protein F5883DRAFT_530745, partial [Diaporthe sp. PMI_573]